ncbi:MAG: hydantoinase B/oxoprolinase family protein [Acidobacteriota bacterium]
MAEIDPVLLEIYLQLLASVAEDMGTVLRRSAYSANIKERRDFSCSVFDEEGRVLAMGEHLPVHLGSLPLSVAAAIRRFEPQPGDVFILNDPFAGGTHLPDITLVAPVFAEDGKAARPTFYVAARAHHADVGGITPGSMPLSEEIFQEGVRIPPLKLYDQGKLNLTLLTLLLHNVRTPLEREGDLAAQVGALRIGEKRLLQLVERNGLAEVRRYCAALHDYAEAVMRRVIEAIPDGTYEGEDVLDDDGVDATGRGKPVRIHVTVTVQGDRIRFDFSRSDPQVPGCLNAVRAITVSAVEYVLRCLGPEDPPTSAGLMRPVEIITAPGTVVDATFPAAVAGGNVETSQRIVDVLLKALAAALPDRIPAASSGTMNNVSIGGFDPVRKQPFTYYETIGGGMGAGPHGPGDSGIHTHMTNSLNTPIEALERYYPIRVREYRIRRRSGGAGLHRGGDGIVRSLEVLAPCRFTILSERRKYAPYGLAGGASGQKGENSLQTRKGEKRRLRGKDSILLSPGDVVVVETPGGGGWGKRR